MKAIILSFGFLLIFSCRSTKYALDTKKNDFSRIQAGRKYIFTNTSSEKFKMKVASVEQDSIIGSFNK